MQILDERDKQEIKDDLSKFVKSLPIIEEAYVESVDKLTLTVNVDELEANMLYKAAYDSHNIVMVKYVFVCTDGTRKTVSAAENADNLVRVTKNDAQGFISVAFDNYYHKVTYGDKSTADVVTVETFKNQKYLDINNSTEFVPTSDYQPTTKKYVDDGFNQLSLEIEEIKENGTGGTGADGIPDYVLTEAQRVAKIVLSKQTAYTLTGIHTSDMHMVYSDEKHYDYVPTSLLHMAQGIREVRNLVKEDYCMDHGDNSWGTGTVDEGRKEINGCNQLLTHAFWGSLQKNKTVGNHDPQTYNVTANDGDYIKENEIFAMFGKQGNGAIYPRTERERGYCYKDFDDYKIRLICLNTCDIKGQTFSTDKAAEYVSGAQMKWFAETLDLSNKEDMEEWEIMFTSHHPLDWGEIMPITNILHAYENGGSCSLTHDGVTITYDYSGKNSAKLIGQIHGHLHNFKVDHIHYLDSDGVAQPLNVQRFCIPNACYLRDNEYGRNTTTETHGIEFGEETTYFKQGYPNTKDDTAFNVVLVCKDTGIIHFINYGRGIDREIAYKEIVPEVTYTNQIAASVESDGTPYNGGLGYKTGTRLSSSAGSESTSGTDVADHEVTGFIPIVKDDDLYFYNTEIDSQYGTFSGVAIYKEDKSFITFCSVSDIISKFGADANGTNITHMKCSHENFTNAKWIRFCGYEINGNSVITKNEQMQ